MKIVIFGNSGSGKSTLAKSLCAAQNLNHLDLDTLAWLPTTPPQRKPLDQSASDIRQFICSSKGWVIEGCYSDLLELVLPDASEIIYLNPPVEICIQNAKQRPWEPHKYPSKSDQDANLDMLIEWIKQYNARTDTFSRQAHQALFDHFAGRKTMITEQTK